MTPWSATIFSSKLQDLRTKASTAVLLSCLAAAAPCSADDGDDFARASNLRRAGHYDASIKILRQLQLRHPNDAMLLTELGTCYMTSNTNINAGLDKATACFRKAIQLNPDLGKAYARLAECYDLQGDYAQGIKLSTRALAVKQPELDALRERAGAYVTLKRDKEALADIEAYIRQCPKRKRNVLIQRATIMENLNMYAQALGEYRGLLKEEYTDSLVHREAQCLEKLSRNEEAIKSLSGLLERNKVDDLAFLHRARLYEKMGKHKEAISDYTKALDFQPSTSALKERASIFEKIGRPDLARKDRNEADKL